MKINSNNLIAEFMGFVNTTPTDKDFNIYQNKEGKMIETMSMEYSTSWDWLMPVVEKIELMGYNVICTPMSTMDGWHCSIESYNEPWNGTDSIDDTKILAIFNSVVQFIKYYNENK